MRQAELWYADLNPVKGSEQASARAGTDEGWRPVLIVSGNLANTYLNTVICCPLTTKIKNYKGNIIVKPGNANGLKEASEILTFHVRSVSKERLVKKIGHISEAELDQLKKCFDEIWKY